MSELLKTKELADLLGLSIHTIHQRRYLGGDLPRAITLSKNVVRYRRSDVERWLEEHTEAEDGGQ